jgi:hypothetical protein
MIKVKNINGTADRGPSDGSASWQEWWEKKKRRRFNKCSNVNCGFNAEVGAHVIKVVSNDKKWYIVPLCKACNAKRDNDAFYVNESDLEAINQ